VAQFLTAITPGIVGLLVALAAYVRARAAHQRIDNLPQTQPPVKGQP
jgi:hypothetical protein